MPDINAREQQVHDKDFNADLKEGRSFKVISENLDVSNGSTTYLYIDHHDASTHRVLIDLLDIEADDSAVIEVFKDITQDTSGTQLSITNLRDSDTDDNPSPVFTAEKGGTYSGMTDANRVDLRNIQPSGTGENTIGDSVDGRYGAISDEGGALLVAVTNDSGNLNDFQNISLRAIQEKT